MKHLNLEMYQIILEQLNYSCYFNFYYLLNVET